MENHHFQWVNPLLTNINHCQWEIFRIQQMEVRKYHISGHILS